MAKRVRTAAGAAYYGVPIGQLITPDQEDDAVARHTGRKPPHGALTGSNQKRAGQETPNSKVGGASAPEAATPKPESKPEATQARQFQASTLSGPVEVFAGKKKFNLPEGSQVFKSPQKSGRVYVVTPDGLGHVLTSSGQLALTPEQSKALGPQIKETLTPDKPKADDQEEEVTWVRLISIVRQIIQAEESGDTSQAKKLLLQFRGMANQYSPTEDSRKVKTRVEKATGIK